MTKQYTLLFPLCFIFGCTILSAQVEFAPIGAQWIYNIELNTEQPDYDPMEDYYTISCTGDTVIDGLYFRIAGDFLLHQEAEKVWYLHDDTLRLVYDFGAHVGDTIQFSFLSCPTMPTAINLYYRVDSVTMVNLNGSLLKKFSTSLLYDLAIGWPNEYVYLEKIGSLRTLIENHAVCVPIPELQEAWLRCYSDNVLEYKSDQLFYHNPEGNCSYKKLSSIETPTTDQLSLSPNPAHDWLYISRGHYNEDAVEYHLYAMDGRYVRRCTPSSSGQIVVSNLPGGSYYLRVFFPKQPEKNILSLPFIKLP